jgi:hypothetical protein
MQPLSKHERLILAVLEEAGEEHVSALANTVEKHLAEGFPDTTQTISTALVHLIKRDLVRVARVRDPIHHRLVLLDIDESLTFANNLELLLERSPTDHLWHWKGDHPIADVALTDSGLASAREILSADGWPDW